MKKSEMVELLSDFLIENNISNDLSEQIVDFMEDKGMKPPSNGHEWIEYGDDFAIKLFNYEWDKE